MLWPESEFASFVFNFLNNRFGGCVFAALEMHAGNDAVGVTDVYSVNTTCLPCASVRFVHPLVTEWDGVAADVAIVVAHGSPSRSIRALRRSSIADCWANSWSSTSPHQPHRPSPIMTWRQVRPLPGASCGFFARRLHFGRCLNSWSAIFRLPRGWSGVEGCATFRGLHLLDGDLDPRVGAVLHKHGPALHALSEIAARRDGYCESNQFHHFSPSPP